MSRAKELRDDIDLLNVVNFGGGPTCSTPSSRVTRSRSTPSPTGTTSLARPGFCRSRRRPWSRRSTSFGDHLPQSGLISARKKIVDALGHDPSEEGLEIAASGGDDSDVGAQGERAIEAGRVLAIDYYKENEDEFTKREIEPYRLANGQQGWYVASFDRRREDIRHFRLDRIKEAEMTKETFEPRPEVEEIAAIEGAWLSGENVPAADVARVWVSPERARWAREEHTVVEELADEAVVIEVPYGSVDWLLREILKGAGELVVLEPESAREAIAQELQVDAGATLKAA